MNYLAHTPAHPLKLNSKSHCLLSSLCTPSLCQGWSRLRCALAPFVMPCVKDRTALTLSPYLPVAPIGRPSQEEVKAHHIFLLPIRVLGVEYILNCVLWRMICAEVFSGYISSKVFSGYISFLRPQRQRWICVEERGPEGNKGRWQGTLHVCVCVCVLGGGGVFVNPQPTHRGNDFRPGRFISLQKVGKGEQPGFRGGCGV